MRIGVFSKKTGGTPMHSNPNYMTKVDGKTDDKKRVGADKAIGRNGFAFVVRSALSSHTAFRPYIKYAYSLSLAN